MIDLTKLVEALIALTVVVITTFIIPWLKSKTNTEKWYKYLSVLDVLVSAAEQIYGVGEGPRKLEQVKEWLEKRGYTFDPNDVEAAVLRLHANGLNYTNAHGEGVVAESAE